MDISNSDEMAADYMTESTHVHLILGLVGIKPDVAYFKHKLAPELMWDSSDISHHQTRCGILQTHEDASFDVAYFKRKGHQTRCDIQSNLSIVKSHGT